MRWKHLGTFDCEGATSFLYRASLLSDRACTQVKWSETRHIRTTIIVIAHIGYETEMAMQIIPLISSNVACRFGIGHISYMTLLWLAWDGWLCCNLLTMNFLAPNSEQFGTERQNFGIINQDLTNCLIYYFRNVCCWTRYLFALAIPSLHPDLRSIIIGANSAIVPVPKRGLKHLLETINKTLAFIFLARQVNCWSLSKNHFKIFFNKIWWVIFVLRSFYSILRPVSPDILYIME